MPNPPRSSAHAAKANRSPVQSAPGVDVAGLVDAGLQHHLAGELDKAQALYNQALRADPDSADALNLSGAIAFTSKRIDDAIRLIGKAIRLKPTHLDAHLNLAEAFETAGRRQEAIETCQKAFVVAPDFAECHARLARLQAADGAYGLALAHARVALALDSQSVEALCARGLAFGRLGKFTEADEAYAEALKLEPDSLLALTGRGQFLVERDFVTEPLELYLRAVALRPNDPALLSSTASLLELDGDILGAQAMFRRALEQAPQSAELRFSLGRCLRDNGKFDEAEQLFNEILAKNPKYSPALLGLARIKKLEDTPDQRNRLARLLADKGAPARHRVQAGFALGEVLDKAEDYDGAFANFSTANALYLQHRISKGEVFSRNDLRARIDVIDDHLAAEYAGDTAGWGNPTELPVFVVGLPRSGTTLIEQICASHSQVRGLGEMKDIQLAARTIAEHNAGRHRIGDWDADFARREADRHLGMLEASAQGALRAVDKTPLNLMRLGVIGAMYPNARVIWCRRDPRDVVVSNHTLFFGAGNLFSTDQSDCAYAVRQTDRLGHIWRKHSKLRILEVGYEDLVADLDTHVRRITDFLELDWEPQCLNFHQTERHVDTPSSWQVRQPIYSSSVGRWRRFEKHLDPMLRTLAADD